MNFKGKKGCVRINVNILRCILYKNHSPEIQETAKTHSVMSDTDFMATGCVSRIMLRLQPSVLLYRPLYPERARLVSHWLTLTRQRQKILSGKNSFVAETVIMVASSTSQEAGAITVHAIALQDNEIFSKR